MDCIRIKLQLVFDGFNEPEDEYAIIDKVHDLIEQAVLEGTFDSPSSELVDFELEHNVHSE